MSDIIERMITLFDVVRHKQEIIKQRKEKYRQFAINNIQQNVIKTSEDNNEMAVLYSVGGGFNNINEFKYICSEAVKEIKARDFKYKFVKEDINGNEHYKLVIFGW